MRSSSKPGTTGGQVIFADWQEATEFNQYYQAQVTEANLTSATQGGLVTSTLLNLFVVPSLYLRFGRRRPTPAVEAAL